MVGVEGDGTSNITDGGLVSVNGLLTIDPFDTGNSFLNMAGGGMLAVNGEADSSLNDFLDLVEGADAIRCWDATVPGWADITGATEDVDYTLDYLSTGDLAGSTKLTVNTTIPEPSSILLLCLGAFSLFGFARRRK